MGNRLCQLTFCMMHILVHASLVFLCLSFYSDKVHCLKMYYILTLGAAHKYYLWDQGKTSAMTEIHNLKKKHIPV